ncbi:hypothetical protein [Gracilimonas sp. BCB1]|uniref:hypothetical protein n=1 Tax=Gracilimonas sp. BCB1 TaxID=3152362 RepID=UPI0032D97474
MNISTNVRHITPDFNKSFGGYEWWYFDGLSEDGQQGFVIIFYQTNPFSTQYIRDLEGDKVKEASYPAISVSLYKGGKTVYYSFLEYEKDEFSWDEDKKKLSVQNDSVSYIFDEKEAGFKITLNQQLPSGHKVEGTVTGKAQPVNKSLIQSSSEDRHSWNLLYPQVSVVTKLNMIGRNGEEELNFSGAGYHDHNTGQEPMKESFRDWYWGRYHFKDFTLIYYLMQKRNTEQFEAWLIDRENQQVLEKFSDAEMSYFTRNWFGLKSARKIELKAGKTIVNIQCRNKIDDGPFYQRFRGESIVNYKGQVYAAHGFSEYIHPSNIYNRVFWPLVKMRLNDNQQNPHWVQKSRLMYPWTW